MILAKNECWFLNLNFLDSQDRDILKQLLVDRKEFRKEPLVVVPEDILVKCTSDTGPRTTGEAFSAPR
eukprot:scaffold3666_cov160-Amphora_coffeaeformis.AAC.20